MGATTVQDDGRTAHRVRIGAPIYRQEFMFSVGQAQDVAIEYGLLNLLRDAALSRQVGSRNMDQAILRVTAVGIQSMTRLVDGKLARADRLSDRSADLYGEVRESRFGLRFGQDPFVTIQGLGAVAKLLRGRIPESVQAITRSVDVARRIDHPYTVAETLKLAAMYLQNSGEQRYLLTADEFTSWQQDGERNDCALQLISESEN